jgi:hypothetical protein
LQLSLKLCQLLVEVLNGEFKALHIFVILLDIFEVDVTELSHLLVLEDGELLDRLVHEVDLLERPQLHSFRALSTRGRSLGSLRI